MPDNFFLIRETLHGWLFPRTSLAIHHGGSGTTHSACRAGVPSVVLPFTGDQFFRAAQLGCLGMAEAPVSTRDVSSDTLRQAVRFARSAGARSRASALAEAMLREDGTGVAVAEIESILEKDEEVCSLRLHCHPSSIRPIRVRR